MLFAIKMLVYLLLYILPCIVQRAKSISGTFDPFLFVNRVTVVVVSLKNIIFVL